MPREDVGSPQAIWKRHYRGLRHGAVLVLLILYLTLGAVVFHLLETEAETARQQTAALRLQQLLENRTCISLGDLKQLLAVAREFADAEVSQNTNTGVTVQLPTSNWLIDRAFFFSLTVLTTIGYGDPVPKTPGGQVFCLFYALFGIPLFLLVLANIGSRIARDIAWLTGRVFRSRLPPGCWRFHAVQFGLLFVLGAIPLLVLPSVGLMYAEGWTYPESVYYAFITLSTIGFGDYVVDRDRHIAFKVIFTLWIPVGLAWFSSLLSTLQLILPLAPEETSIPNPEPGCISNNHDIPTNIVQDLSIRNPEEHTQSEETSNRNVFPRGPPLHPSFHKHHINTVRPHPDQPTSIVTKTQ